jgi:hypothetical protein
MNSSDEELDSYLKENQPKSRKAQRQKSGKSAPAPKKKRTITDFMMWRSSAANDLFMIYMVLAMLTIIGGICLIINVTIGLYFLYAAGIVLVPSLLWCCYDYYHYLNWVKNLNYKLEGWTHALNSRSPNFWLMNGEYWVPTRITISIAEPVNQKHYKVTEVFLKKLCKKLNKWTVSSEKHFGYSQPNGWTHDGLTLVGDMNARVSNLIRKHFSKEFSRLTRLMKPSQFNVAITCSGKEEYHEVYVDPSSD